MGPHRCFLDERTLQSLNVRNRECQSGPAPIDTSRLNRFQQCKTQDLSFSSSSIRHHGKTHQEPFGEVDSPDCSSISSCRRIRSILLAKDLLGLPNDKFRPDSQAVSYTPDNQPLLRNPRARMGMACEAICRNMVAPKHRVQTPHAATFGAHEHSHVPEYECRAVLPNWHGGVFLGI